MLALDKSEKQSDTTTELPVLASAPVPGRYDGMRRR